MRRPSKFAMLLSFALAVHAGLVCAEAEGPELPIRKVVLYKHGVGYFERVGTVEGDARIALHFKAEDMSDLLKSLTVLDLGGGTIRTIAYDSTKTVDQQLGEYTFDLRKAKSLPQILEQMKGSEVTLRIVDKDLAGRLLAVEKRLERKDDVQVETYLVSILMPGGMVKSYDLAEVSDIRFSSPRLQKEMEDYLRILFSRHKRDEKEVVIRSSGSGKRRIFVSYVQEQPVWKVSYRIVTAKEEKPLLQAWAIVDNVSDEDWENVSLSLVSGLPISFVQNLYDPFYVKRPEIRLQRETAMAPVLHEAGEAMFDAARAPRAARDASRAVRKEAETSAERRRGRGALALRRAGGAAPSPDMLANMAQQAAAAVAKATGALFVYDIKEPVTIRRDRSALLPIASSRVEGERVSIYNESTRRDNPMDAIRLKNTTGLTLEGGPVMVIEDNTYSGEALMETLKPDEQRYISFAVDLGTRVNTKLGSRSQKVYRVRIVRGTMITEYKEKQTKVYNLSNLEDKDKTVVVEHPFRQNWKLVDMPKPIETTPKHYRFETKLPAKKKATFGVTEERPGETRYAITNIARDQILYFVRQKYIDPETQAFLEKVVGLQAEIAALKKQIDEKERQRKSIFENQDRLRRNLQALGRTEAERSLRNRYVKQFGEEEDRIQKINEQIDDLQDLIRRKQEELDRLLTTFTFETKV